MSAQFQVGQGKIAELRKLSNKGYWGLHPEGRLFITQFWDIASRKRQEQNRLCSAERATFPLRMGWDGYVVALFLENLIQKSYE